jgi:hypothetical protein
MARLARRTRTSVNVVRPPNGRGKNLSGIAGVIVCDSAAHQHYSTGLMVPLEYTDNELPQGGDASMPIGFSGDVRSQIVPKAHKE